MSELVTPSVVLRTRALRESDLIVILLTPGHGKIDCIARGARRSRRRFPGGLPVGARGEAGIGQGRGSLLPLVSFTASSDHSRLGRDLETFAYVSYVCELADQLVGGSMADPTCFGRLCEAIEDAIARPEPSVLRRFELGLLDAVGLLPALERCGVCDQPALADEGGGVPFSAERGGVACLAHGRGARRVPAEVLALALALLHDEPEARRAHFDGAEREIRRGLRDLCRDLLRPQLRGSLRSLAFFAQLPGKSKGTSEA